MAAPQRRRPARRGGRANSDAERRALAKASGRRTGPAPRAPRPGYAVLASDGGSRGNPGPAAIGYELTGADGTMLASHGETIGVTGANVAEYRALLAGLEHASRLGLDRVEARCDARLVVEHVTGVREPANPRLRELCDRVRDTAERIGSVVITWVPAEANGRAHALVAEALAEWSRSGSMPRSGVRVGIADHLGWAVAVAATAEHAVADRRRIELVEPGLSTAPIHYDRGRLDDAAAAALVETVRRSAIRTSAAALDDLAAALPGPVVSISLRAWPPDFPEDIAVQRRAPYESRADAIMYRQVLAELAHERGWAVHCYDAKAVEAQAAELLGERADEVLRGPRATLGPPWNKDHRMALAATVAATPPRT